jgi:hypothetical protein
MHGPQFDNGHVSRSRNDHATGAPGLTATQSDLHYTACEPSMCLVGWYRLYTLTVLLGGTLVYAGRAGPH